MRAGQDVGWQECEAQTLKAHPTARRNHVQTRATTTSWDDAKLISPNQVLAVASIASRWGWSGSTSRWAYLDIDDTGLAEAGYGPVTP
jgi:hypothetical protein